MIIYEALKKDHREVQGLLERLVGSDNLTNEAKSGLISKIRDGLIPHSRAEEAVFYNSLRTIDGTESIAMHGYAEHMEAEAVLRTLQALDVMHVDFKKTALKLQKDLNHHIAEEEGKMFTMAKQVLATEEAEMMGVAFEKMKPEIKEGGIIKSTLDLIGNLMPVRFAEPLRKFTQN